MKKRIVVLSLAFVLLFGAITSCGKKPEADPASGDDVGFEDSMANIGEIGELLSQVYREERLETRRELVERIAELRFGGSFIPVLLSEEELAALPEEAATLDAAYNRMDPNTDMTAMEENLGRQFEILLLQLYNDSSDFEPTPPEEVEEEVAPE